MKREMPAIRRRMKQHDGDEILTPSKPLFPLKTFDGTVTVKGDKPPPKPGGNKRGKSKS
jgi:hypothetical protein